MPARKPWTDAKLAALPKEQGKFELIEGKLHRTELAGWQHSVVLTKLILTIYEFVKPERLGVLFGYNTGFRLDPETVLSPDAAYACREWVEQSGTKPGEFVRGAPELAVEVVSLSEDMVMMRWKIERSFTQGTRLFWLVDPRRQQLDVYISPTTANTLEKDGELDGGDVLPGFRLPLAAIFAGGF